MLGWAVVAARRGWMPQNRFHVYLIAYGVFRFASEFARDERPMIGPFTGYHFIAIGIALLGTWRLLQRLRAPLPAA
jgi:phosphatidylglycerol:prolipoprotein diacylglycerol transferase